MKYFISFLVLMLMLIALIFPIKDLYAKKKIARKVQSYDFSGEAVDGKRNDPIVDYLVQKKEINFVPLYEVKVKFKQKIDDSIYYMR